MRIVPLISALLLLPAATRAADSDADAQFFETRIRPVLVEQCYQCHSATAKKLKASLYVDSLQGLLTGGESGPAIVPGHPEQSRLIEAIGYKDADVQMPPKTKLPDQAIADLTQWIQRGAPWPGGAATQPAKSTAVAAFDLQKRRAAHWCWQPIKSQEPPSVKDQAWPRSPIDRFILAELEQKGLQPAPPAERRVLIRRVSFDLTGLPPTPQAVEAFVADASPDAFAKVVDGLLASPHFGERWARHWMDLVRFAETRGHEFDSIIPNAFQYRDYLIRAFNADVPYDQFLTEHLAGDLLDRPRLNPIQGFNESILGTGFWFLGEEIHSPVDIRQDEADRMNSRLDTMTKAFIGMTVGCARCHDHKFDAISTKDYYALTGFLLSSTYRQVPFESLEHNKHIAEQLHALRIERRAALLKLAARAEREGVNRAADLMMATAQTAAKTPVAQVVRGRGIDDALLEKWVAMMPLAARDPAHPLHVFAKLALSPAARDPARFASMLQAVRESLIAPPPTVAPTQIVVDYTTANAGWWEDGWTFGTGPTRAGELDLGSAADPALGVTPFSAARRDFAWPTVHDAGTEHELGKLGAIPRSGRTLRTATVTLQSGKIWYLVRGPLDVYADVDSHLMVSGPLHGALIKQIKGGPNKWHWVPHDLSAYAGQRVHFEFTPYDNAALAVAKVIESDSPPASVPTTNRLVAQVVGDPAVQTLDGLAAGYQKLLARVTDRLETDQIIGAADAGDMAELADWLVQNPDLFGRPDSSERAALVAAVADAVRAQADLVQQVQIESHAAPAMLDGNGVDEHVLVRGVARNAGELIPRRFLEALAGSQPAYPTQSSGRLQLAAAMLSPENPFTARVMANRIWQHLMGAGIVPTVDNFGVLGQLPTHPELLDYLADTFRKEDSWSVKKLIRAIVLSSTYQMSSRPEPSAEQADPQDALLHRMPVRRLEAEAIRDQILAVSSRLDERVGGPSVEVFITPFMDGRGRPAGSGPLDGDGRRSIYTRIRRNFLSPMMLAYDTPIPFACVGRRSVSNVPAQALILMNDPFVVQQAHMWATRVLADKDATAEQRIAGMYLKAFSRPPTAEEASDGKAFIEQMAQAYNIPASEPIDDERPWADYAHVLFNVKEFIFIR